jgi:asparagine synthase (glutamine-hydrolysing)
MQNEPIPLLLGMPKFLDPAIAALACEAGPLAAWRALFARGAGAEAASAAATAAATVTGDFAVAITDASDRSFLAVDRFAIRSLCYRIVDGRLRVAERADDLADSEPAIDPQAIFDYLYFHAIPSPRTVFAGVYRLPPGYCAVFDAGRLTVMRYWTPRFEAARPAKNFDAWRTEFRGLLRDAVAAQLGRGKAACFLSGGTDSSTVAGMIGEASGRAAATYSIGFDADGYDEMAYARLAARHFGTEHHEYYVTPDDLVRSIGSVASSYDQPFGNSSALPAYYCARMARDDGVERILAGDGGDELFGGNTRYAKQRVFNAYGAVPEGLRRGLVEPLFGVGALRSVPILRKVSSYVDQARQPMPLRMQTYNLLSRLGVARVLTPGFLGAIDADDPTRQQAATWSHAETSSQLNRQLAFDWRYTLAETDLPKVCGTTRLAGLEVGFPMLDARLVDFSLQLPEAYKLRGLKLRWFFKEALRGFLPDQILTKKKQGFGLPFGVWATRHAGLARLAADSLGSLAERGIVQPAFIRALLDRHLAEHPGYYGEMVWILMMLEQWLQVHAPRYRWS